MKIPKDFPKFEKKWRLKIEDVYDRIEKVCNFLNYQFIDFVNHEWVGVSTRLILKCLDCEMIWETTTYEKLVHRGQGCPNCKNKKIALSKRRSITEVTEKINKACEENNITFIDFVDSYVNGSTKLILKCNVCGNIWNTTTYNNLVFKKHGCTKCKKGIKYSEEEATNLILQKCNQNNLSFLGYKDGLYKNALSKLVLKCNSCGRIWDKASYNDLVNGNIKCKICFYKHLSLNKRIDEQTFIKRLNDICLKKDLIVLKYNFIDGNINESIIQVKCLKCNNIWETKYGNLSIKGRYCPNCKISYLEQDIMKLLMQENINYTHNKHYSFLKNLQLDFYIPSKNIAIECQGIQHFKPIDFANKGDEWAEKEYQKVLKRDQCKRQLCEEHGIKLLYYSNLGIEYPYQVYEDKNELLKIIIENDT